MSAQTKINIGLQVLLALNYLITSVIALSDFNCLLWKVVNINIVLLVQMC